MKASEKKNFQQWDIETIQERLRAHCDEVSANFMEEGEIILVDDFSQLHILEETTQTKTTVIGYCSSGSCTLRINMKDCVIRANDLLCILPDQWICLVKNDNFHCSFLVLNNTLSLQLLPKVQNIVQYLFDFYLFVRENPCIPLTDEEIATIQDYQHFLCKRKEKELFRKEIQQHMLMSLMYELCNIAGRIILQQKNKSKNRKTAYTEQFLIELSQNFRKERSVQFYADRLRISPKYLSGIIKEVSGKQASQWIEEAVVNEARHLLDNTAMSIQEVANELHFCNQSFFGKFFKEHTGLSPKNYRKKAE